jgi:hypothetical protein
MARNGEYHLVMFDPGGTIGWAHLVFDLRAFSRPDHKALRYLRSWDCGEFTGTEHEQLVECGRLIYRASFDKRSMIRSGRCHIVTEDFELTQMIGGKNLLSPVRINAVLDWQCARQGITLNYQRRTMRTNITPVRLVRFGFPPPAGKSWNPKGSFKDAFAAMQHAIVWVRRQKAASHALPWKLANNLWDCGCAKRLPCTMRHPM